MEQDDADGGGKKKKKNDGWSYGRAAVSYVSFEAGGAWSTLGNGCKKAFKHDEVHRSNSIPR